jgi:hypothetical protein
LAVELICQFYHCHLEVDKYHEKVKKFHSRIL